MNYTVIEKGISNEPVKKPNRLLQFFKKLFSFIVTVGLLAAVLFTFRLVVLDGPSMTPTYTPGDFAFCMRSFTDPKPNDVVLIRAGNTYMLKRVVAVAGGSAVVKATPSGYENVVSGDATEKTPVYDTGWDVESGSFTAKGVETIDGVAVEDYWTTYYYWNSESVEAARVAAAGTESEPDATHISTINTTIPDGYVFVVGDNLVESYDSRDPEFGLVPVENIWGTVLFTIPTLK